MTSQLHYLPDGRIKVGDHYIADEIAVELIYKLYMRCQTMTTTPNTPWEAIQTINDVLEVGSKKHPPASWRSESAEHHATKALGHLKDWVYGVYTNPQGEDTLAHALTRLAMAVSVRRSE